MTNKSIKTKLLKAINENFKAKNGLKKNEKLIKKAVELFYDALKKGNKILICGNGGSAADAQHLAAELLVRLRPKVNRRPYPVMSLAMDTSTLTACGNDYNFNNIFMRNLDAFGSKDDVLLAISTSGNSVNILKAIKMAKKKKLKSIGFFGFKGGKAKNLVDLPLIIKSNNVARIQEAHIFLGHFIFEEVERLLIKKN